MGFEPRVIENLERMLGKKKIQEVIELFLNDAPRRMRNVRDHLGSNHAKDAATGLHSLRSSAEMLGAIELGEITEKMERRLNTGEGQPIEALMTELDRAFVAAVEHLRTYTSESDP